MTTLGSSPSGAPRDPIHRRKHAKGVAVGDNAGKAAEKVNEPSSMSLADSVVGVKLPESLRAVRGHDFFPAESANWPALYATDGDGPLRDKTIVAHYFTGGNDWYISEFDPATGEAFGYAQLGAFPDNAEWGYIDLTELEQFRSVPAFSGKGISLPIMVERDCHFDGPKKAHEVIEKYRAEKELLDNAGRLLSAPGDEDDELSNEPFVSKILNTEERVAAGLSHDEAATYTKIGQRAYDFTGASTSPIPDEAERREFSQWCQQRYLNSRETAGQSVSALVVQWMANNPPKR